MTMRQMMRCRLSKLPCHLPADMGKIPARFNYQRIVAKSLQFEISKHVENLILPANSTHLIEMVDSIVIE
jgi:hypothetical protein